MYYNNELTKLEKKLIILSLSLTRTKKLLINALTVQDPSPIPILLIKMSY